MILLRLLVTTAAIVLIGLNESAAPLQIASYTLYNLNENRIEIQMAKEQKAEQEKINYMNMKMAMYLYICEASGSNDFTSIRNIVDVIYDASIRYELPIGLIMAIIEKESDWRIIIKNKYGARGLMQIVLRYKSGNSMWQDILISNKIIIVPLGYKNLTKKEKNKICDKLIYDIKTNINAGCYILRHYIDQVYFSRKDKTLVMDSYLAEVLRHYSGNHYSKDRGDSYINKVCANWWKIEKFMNENY